MFLLQNAQRDRSLLPKCQSAGHRSSGIIFVIVPAPLTTVRQSIYAEGPDRRFNVTQKNILLSAVDISLNRDFERSQLLNNLFSVWKLLHFRELILFISKDSYLISRSTPSPGEGWSIKYVPVVCVLLIIIKSKQLSKMKSVLSLSLCRAGICNR